jgi:uncharacterized protein YndB with AHSA1/START domain
MTLKFQEPVAARAASTRSATVTLPLDAPVDTVWRALTDPEELVHWFPTNAAVDPRPGGAFVISWNGAWQWEMTITDFEPLKRLRMIDRLARPFDANGQPLLGEAPLEQALEITIEPAGRGTTLRLVHSGFGHGAAWDDELDGVTLGWNVELRGLRHYLAHHRGRRRQTASAHTTSRLALGPLWDRLTAPAGFITSGVSPDLAEGDACTLTLVTGDLIDGKVRFAEPGRQLLVAADNFGDGLFRLSLDRAAGEAMVQVWLSTWAVDPGIASTFEARLRPALVRIVGAA